ncbi:MAG: hypothetical protein IJN25_02760 [Clostridia bacterium]|nr:hypothetical protein [Clostridia bacterium]
MMWAIPPLCATASIEKPTDNAEYMYKAFAQDGIGTMRSKKMAKTLR